ncbi:MAG: aspartate--tRNA(Asn) ligase [Candidatus Micrarchaeota archaeon]|nr:aspartate--tRNA(Asn) ligase [Candidatus Micrarchaeota archaeon]
MLRTHYVNQLSVEMNGQEVTLAGWAHEVRETSNITFLLLRDQTGVVQVVGKTGAVDDSIIKSLSVPKESVLRVVGTVSANPEAKKGFEIIPKSVENLNPLQDKIPFEVTGKVPAEIDVRLNYRYIDLRRSGPTAVFKIQSTILGAFREYLSKAGFQEIRTPSIIAEASEGGSDLFSVKYFERDAYLAQSPQLYKQLAVIGGMDKVMMVVPVFRAEKSNTTYHITESTQMDIEMGFAGPDDAIKVLNETVIYMLKQVRKKNSEEFEQFGEKLKIPKIKTVTYSDAITALKKKGYEIEFGHDISRDHEQGLQKLYGDAVVVTNFPASIRAFYSMPMESSPELTNSYDFIYKGLEICSGAQRIHKPELLVRSLEKKGLNPKDFESYISAFKYGAPPHAGWSIGLERFTMQVVGVQNIREASLFPRDRNRLSP